MTLQLPRFHGHLPFSTMGVGRPYQTSINPEIAGMKNRHHQRGFAGLLLAVLFLLMLGLPMLYLQSDRAEEQRARDRAIKKMLTQPAPPPRPRPASAAP